MRFLVTTDGSLRSRQVLPHAARLARATGAELLLLRVLDPRADCGDEHDAALAEAVDRVAAEWTRELQRLGARTGVPTTPAVVTKDGKEDIARAILRAAGEERAQLICMATRGASLVHGALLGSVAVGVLGKTKLPLMLVGEHCRQPRRSARPYHLLITTDGSKASESVWPGIQGMLKRVPADRVRLTTLEVYAEGLGSPDREEALRITRRELSSFKRRAPRGFPVASEVRLLVELGGVGGKIVNTALELETDSIWMGAHGASLRRRILLGSVTMSVLGRSPVPVVLSRIIE